MQPAQRGLVPGAPTWLKLNSRPCARHSVNFTMNMPQSSLFSCCGICRPVLRFAWPIADSTPREARHAPQLYQGAAQASALARAPANPRNRNPAASCSATRRLRIASRSRDASRLRTAMHVYGLGLRRVRDARVQGLRTHVHAGFEWMCADRQQPSDRHIANHSTQIAFGQNRSLHVSNASRAQGCTWAGTQYATRMGPECLRTCQHPVACRREVDGHECFVLAQHLHPFCPFFDVAVVVTASP